MVGGKATVDLPEREPVSGGKKHGTELINPGRRRHDGCTQGGDKGCNGVAHKEEEDSDRLGDAQPAQGDTYQQQV